MICDKPALVVVHPFEAGCFFNNTVDILFIGQAKLIDLFVTPGVLQGKIELSFVLGSHASPYDFVLLHPERLSFGLVKLLEGIILKGGSHFEVTSSSFHILSFLISLSLHFDLLEIIHLTQRALRGVKLSIYSVHFVLFQLGWVLLAHHDLLLQ